jgi:hypothetical protein
MFPGPQLSVQFQCGGHIVASNLCQTYVFMIQKSAARRTAASHIGEEMLPFRELVEHYREKARALLAFVGPSPPHEVYLLAPCELANAVLKSAKKAAGPEMEVRIPAAVSGDQLLAVIIHRKVCPHFPVITLCPGVAEGASERERERERERRETLRPRKLVTQF